MAEEHVIKKVAIAVPNESMIHFTCYDNHIVHAMQMGAWEKEQQAENRPIQYQFYWYTTGRLLTQMAREKLMRVARDNEMDYIIMHDDDMLLPRDFAKNLLLRMESNPEVSVLAALAFMRTPPHYPVLYTVTKGFDTVRNQDYYFNQNVKRYPKDSLVECDAVGFGGVCIDMKFVREKMQEPYFMSTTQTGEDIWFCVQAKEAGGRVFMDTSIKMGHMKNPEVIDEEGYDKYIKETNHDVGEETVSKYNAADK